MTHPEPATGIERLLANTFGRDLTVHVSEAMEDRLHPFFDAEDECGHEDHDLTIALLACAERGLDEDVADWGPWRTFRRWVSWHLRGVLR